MATVVLETKHHYKASHLLMDPGMHNHPKVIHKCDLDSDLFMKQES